MQGSVLRDRLMLSADLMPTVDVESHVSLARRVMSSQHGLARKKHGLLAYLRR
jgi:hypothetical protein